MKTAMQELLEYIENTDSFVLLPDELSEIIKDKYLKKEKKQITPLIDALEDIKNWDDDLEVEWGDCGERAISALKIFKENK
jgi:hypothetical protein